MCMFGFYPLTTMDIHKLFMSLFILQQLFAVTFAASFFGASYMTLPLEEARKNTEISFKMKTYRSNALLLLAAGETDYCLILLEGGALRVRINLGAGESELSSPPRLRLDDLLWHEVYLERKTAELKLTIDNIHVTRLSLGGRFHELNIHQGIFVGGLGDFTELFLGIMQNFRGCLDEVKYNNIDIFQEVQRKKSFAEVYAVKWECAEEFEASADVPISFMETGAYISFDKRFGRTGGSIHMEIKTDSENALILYNSGPPSKSDFVALEILNKKLRLILDQGNGPVDLNSTLLVSDGSWHNVDVRFSPTHLEVSLDGGVESKLTATEADNKYFDLTGFLFIGGVEVNRRSRAVQQGTLNGDKSMRGCIKGLKVNDKTLGIRDPRVTMGILTECQWTYPCVKNPCVQSAKCIQEGTDSFRCECDMALCVRQDFMNGYSVFTKTSQPVDLEILSLSPVEVTEGGQALITKHHLNVVLDYIKYGIRETGIMFHIFEHPKHGTVKVTNWDGSDKRLFTQLDVTNDKVSYTHDGLENKEDSIVFELELNTQTGYILPSYLQTRHKFVLPVTIISVNDPPSVVVPPGRALRLPYGTKVPLTPALLNASDPDNEPKELKYNVLNLKDGIVESLHNPGHATSEFTQEDVNLGLISYQHSGRANTEIIFKVTDGHLDTPNNILRVTAFDLNVYLINNTGLHMTHNSWSFITNTNLSCGSNTNHDNLEIKYQITEPARYGSIQRLKNNNWQPVNSFTNRQIEKLKIRYEHTNKKPQVDEIKFRLEANQKQFQKELTFRITFVSLSVEIINNAELLIDRIQESFISEGFLRTVTQPSQTPPEKLIYTIVSTPHYGSIIKSSGDLSLHSKLRVSSNFTQEDIAKGRIKYKLHYKTYSQFHDTFEFFVSARGQSSNLHSFNIRYKPPPLDASVTVKDIDVEEGGKHRITEKYLKIERKGLKKMIYNITAPPQHGVLVKNRGLSYNTVGTAVTQFTSDDVYSGVISYHHDGSETIEDHFYFLAFSHDSAIDFQYVGLMNINIMLKNDHPPVRVLEKVLNVVTNGERVVTKNDLQYIDPDLSTQPYQLVYARRKISNGDFYHINQRTQPIYTFTQEDINKMNILFHHNGPIYSKAHITVSDGKLSTSGTLEIVASDPFVEVFNNSGVIVPRSGHVVITNQNLSAETNLNAWGNSIIFRIIQEPQHGYLKVQGKAVISYFTEYDLENNYVEYHHNGNSQPNDEFRFKASVGEVETEGVFDIKIFPESYWEPLLIAANISAEVEESSIHTLDQSEFHVMHPTIAPEDIIYTIRKLPKFGKLEIETNILLPNHDNFNLVSSLEYDDYGMSEFDLNEETSFKHKKLVFSQKMINEGRVRYIPTAKNSTFDFFIFDVTNGIIEAKSLYFYFQIIPQAVYVTTSTINVNEGSKVVLTSTLITILSPYYRERLNSLLVLSQPAKGLLQRTSRPGQRLVGFTPQELDKGIIEYVHDGSESTNDVFTLVAVSDNRRSAPVRVTIRIKPVNDEYPKVLANEQILLWEGETIKLTKEYIDVQDKDTKITDIVFKIWSPDCGFLSLWPNVTHPITKFTQADVNNGIVFFTHTGALRGKIQWEAFDGNFTSEIQFTQVQAKPLHLRIIRNKPLFIFPLSSGLITSNNLIISTNALNLHRSVTYKIRKGPSLGKLMIEDANGILRQTNNFTQRNINESKVIYKQIKPIHELSVGDSFVFEAVTPFAEPLLRQTFDIRITVGGEEGGELGKYLKLAPLSVVEGESETLSTHNLNLTAVSEFLQEYSGTRRSTYLFAKLIDPPIHGNLYLRGRKLKVDDQFRSSDIEQGWLTYNHDGNDNLLDKVKIRVYLVNSAHSSPDVLLYNGYLNITISPVNDKPFKLMTQIPGMVVVRGQKAPISRKNLLTEDADNEPKDIVYEVMSGPDYGKLFNSLNYSFPIHSFTQEDINKNLIWFVHDGSNSSAKFYFQVSDGAHKPKYTVFTINIELLHITLINHTTVLLQQASSSAYITPHNLATVTNGDSTMVFYNISRPPKYGKLIMNNIPVTTLSQLNITSKKLMYFQEDFSAAGDSFVLNAGIYDQAIKDIEVRILVKPLLHSEPLSAVVGSQTRLTLQHLNATELAMTTNSLPVFQIQRLPRLGRIKIISRRNKRSGRSYQVKEFSHEDIIKGKVYYVARKLRMQSSEPLHDSLSFVLIAASPYVQPAHGVLAISLVSTLMEDAAEGRHLRPELLPEERNPAAPSRPNPEVTSNGINKDYLLLATVAIGITVILILILIVVKCSVQKNSAKKNKNRNLETHGNRMDIDVASLPPPACTDSRPNSFMTEDFSEIEPPLMSPIGNSPPPGVHLLPQMPVNGILASPHLSDSEASWPREVSREVSPSVPQCKVTPLCPDISYHSPCQSPSQPPLSIAGYPYGADTDQVEEWSMYETQPLRTTNPMLRKNQYWV